MTPTKALKKAERRNPLRRIRTDCACLGWRRDALAVVGDWLWCDPCGNKVRVIEVVE